MIALDPSPYLRPSSAEPIERCPARPAMEARAVAAAPCLAELVSEPARQGTMAHAAIAGVLADCAAGDWRNAPEVLAGLGPRMAGLARWAADATQACLRYALDLIRQLLGRWAVVEVLVEQPLDGRGIGMPRGGSADLVLLCRVAPGAAVARIIIVDWKTGFVSQGDAADHLQLACYAVMARDRWLCEWVEVHLAMGRRREFSSAEYDREALMAARVRILALTDAATDPDAEIRPGLTACRYCRALPFCRPAREDIMRASDSFALFGVDPHNRVRLQEDAGIAKRFAEAAAAALKEMREAEARP